MKNPTSLPPIPTPVSERWKDFRLAGVPFLVFALALIAVVLLWGRNLSRPDVVGEVQARLATVSCSIAGELVELNVEQFQSVRQGEELGRVRLGSPQTVAATLAAAKADLLVTRARMVLDQHRNLFNYQSFRLDVLLQRIDLATARIQLRQAEGELERASRLLRENIVAAGVATDGSPGYEVALRDRDALQTQVTERERVLAQMESLLEETRPQTEPEKEPLIEEAITAAIAAHEALIRLEDDQVLRSPIDGVVTLINRRAGENILGGEPLLQISGEQPERIIGFIRPPLVTVPEENQQVEVRTRGYPTQRMPARVVRVGVKLELFSQPLRLRGFGAAQERGLPILVEVPDGLKVHPGELVDLFIPRPAL